MTNEPVARTILTLRLLALAVAGGIVVFGVVATVLVSNEVIPARPELGAALLPALLVAAVLMIVVYAIVSRALRAALRQEATGGVPSERLLAHFRALHIIGSALAELPAMFGIVVFLLTRRWVALLAPALGLGALLLSFPSRDTFARFADGVSGGREI